jgi:NRPS condensation-like uncharacterized protein
MNDVLTMHDQNAAPQMHRRLGPFEHLLWLVDQWTPRHFIFVARIEGSSISEEDLSAALLQSQRRHPILRTTIHLNDDGDPEFIPSCAPISLRVVQRISGSQWLHEVETQLAIPFERDDRSLLRVSLVQDEDVSELILAVHHSIGDGVSAMHLVRDLLESMEGNRLEELPPQIALEEFLLSGATDAINQLHQPAETSSLRTKFDRPERALLQVFEINPSELIRILERSREEDATFHSALLAALLFSLPGHQTVRCLSPINVRKFVPTVSEDFGLYISSGMAFLDRNTATSFWPVARCAREQLMQASDPQALRAGAAAMASVVAGKLNPQTAYERVWRSIGYNAVLTNFGPFPDISKLKRFRVTAAYPILSPELEPVIAVATADKRTYITISSPPALAGIGSTFFDQLRQNTN